MQWSSVAGLGVGYGLVVSVLFTLALIAGFLVSRDFLLGDYPPAIQERYGRPRSARGRRVALWVGVVFWGLCFLPLLAVAILHLRATVGGDLGFLAAAVCAAIVFGTMSVFDLVVLDWLIFAGLRPRFMVLPGTEGMPEYRDLKFHLVEGAKGSPLIVVVGLVAGGVVAAVEAVV
ncbi:hypothetical protein [Nonomuraea basaltis]|uniref:hypothetical protein n=1 Tax=Nonomuraea basaltis TaxID=2495887 RepID=UPI00110C6591|nr:hypothetical protein [Nonomuraea basaltis]TMS00545.1 hypothetical protein EJK15_00920 [Nonomuraea basaltis]